MNIILVSGATARARTITLDWRHWSAGAATLLVLFLVFTFMFNFVTLKWAAAVQHPLLQAFVLADQREEAAKASERVQGHLNAMALKVGELQARVMRLDGLGERLAKTAGLKPQELPTLPAGAAPGRGGAVSSLPSRDMSVAEFSDLVEKLAEREAALRGSGLIAIKPLATPVPRPAAAKKASKKHRLEAARTSASTVRATRQNRG